MLAGALAFVTAGTFAGVRGNDFVLYDDTLYVTANTRVQQGLTADNVRWAFTTIEASNWHPLTWLSHMLDWQLFGSNATGHHLVSLGWHVANVVLLFWVLYEMTSAPWRSAIVAALFGLHPLHVESVAYVAERKDVLSGVFWMLTMLAYVRYARVPTITRYMAVVVAFGLGLMAKPMLVTLPCVLLLLDAWPLRRVQTVPVWRLVAEKLPLFALSAAASSVTFLAQRSAGSVAPLDTIPFSSRFANACLAYVTYASRVFWPFDLACFYPYPSSFPLWQTLLAVALLGAASLAAFIVRRRFPYVAVGWLWYLGTLVPVIGLVQVGKQAMADRFTYIPLIGLFLVIVWGSYDLLGGAKRGRLALAALATAFLIFLAGRTVIEVGHWRDSFTLFEHAIAVTTSNALAHNNLGLALRDRGQVADAFGHFSQAVAADPKDETARNHLGLALRDLGRFPEAVSAFRESVQMNPDYAGAHFNLGETLLRQGDVTAAAVEFAHTIRLDPNHPGAHLQLGDVRRQQGEATEAIELERRALLLKPNWAEAHSYLADALFQAGQLDEAVAHYREAQRLNPSLADAYYNLGNVYAQRGQIDAAAAEYRNALERAPDHAGAHNNLGRTLAITGDIEEAIVHYSEAVRLDPTLAAAYLNRAKAYEQQGNSVLAADDVARAKELDPHLR